MDSQNLINTNEISLDRIQWTHEEKTSLLRLAFSVLEEDAALIPIYVRHGFAAAVNLTEISPISQDEEDPQEDFDDDQGETDNQEVNDQDTDQDNDDDNNDDDDDEEEDDDEVQVIGYNFTNNNPFGIHFLTSCNANARKRLINYPIMSIYGRRAIAVGGVMDDDPNDVPSSDEHQSDSDEEQNSQQEGSLTQQIQQQAISIAQPQNENQGGQNGMQNYFLVQAQLPVQFPASIAMEGTSTSRSLVQPPPQNFNAGPLCVNYAGSNGIDWNRALCASSVSEYNKNAEVQMNWWQFWVKVHRHHYQMPLNSGEVNLGELSERYKDVTAVSNTLTNYDKQSILFTQREWLHILDDHIPRARVKAIRRSLFNASITLQSQGQRLSICSNPN